MLFFIRRKNCSSCIKEMDIFVAIMANSAEKQWEFINNVYLL